MTPKEYLEACLVTESIDEYQIKQRMLSPEMYRILHAAMGLVTEAGEVLDMLKKHIYYGRDLDLVNIEEELGDLNWYQSIMIDALNKLGHETDLDTILDKNVKKLQKRYVGSFTSDKAINRDLDAERKILEGSDEDK